MIPPAHPTLDASVLIDGDYACLQQDGINRTDRNAVTTVRATFWIKFHAFLQLEAR